MNVNLLTTKTLSGTVNSWTLTSRIGEMLELAQSMFGDRNSDFFFLGIEFKQDGPRIRYQNSKYMLIQLTPNVLDNEYLAYFQLSHEVYHLLSVTGKYDSNNLEEGLATYFSKKYLDRFTQNSFNWELAVKGNPKYYQAYLSVDKLIKFQPDIIKKVRGAFPNIKTSHLTLNEFKKVANEGLPDELIIELLKPFPQNNK